jgi:hypothetical protein
MDQGATIMAGLIKKVLRAAVAQPWDYVGEGAPNDWEFRVSPEDSDGSGHIALYNPGVGRWVIFQDVIPLAQVSTEEMDRHTGDWVQFLAVVDDD